MVGGKSRDTDDGSCGVNVGGGESGEAAGDGGECCAAGNGGATQLVLVGDVRRKLGPHSAVVKK